MLIANFDACKFLYRFALPPETRYTNSLATELVLCHLSYTSSSNLCKHRPLFVVLVYTSTPQR